MKEVTKVIAPQAQDNESVDVEMADDVSGSLSDFESEDEDEEC